MQGSSQVSVAPLPHRLSQGLQGFANFIFAVELLGFLLAPSI
jgi:hypothetical protein